MAASALPERTKTAETDAVHRATVERSANHAVSACGRRQTGPSLCPCRPLAGCCDRSGEGTCRGLANPVRRPDPAYRIPPVPLAARAPAFSDPAGAATRRAPLRRQRPRSSAASPARMAIDPCSVRPDAQRSSSRVPSSPCRNCSNPGATLRLVRAAATGGNRGRHAAVAGSPAGDAAGTESANRVTFGEVRRCSMGTRVQRQCRSVRKDRQGHRVQRR